MATPTTSVADHHDIGWRFENTYACLPDVFFAPARPAKFPEPGLTILNHRLGTELGLALDELSPDAAANLFAGQVLPVGVTPVAQAYAGHQFGGFTMLGDGRAILIGEHRTPSNRLVDLHLKGAGQTRFSRRGDGRAALGPMLREYIISEAMAALGIPTTRSLAVVTTGERVYRDSALQGAVLARVAASHIRVGTFEYLAAREDIPNLRVLADYAIDRHYPDLCNAPEKYLAFFRAVMDRQASLIAQWQLVGFIHGVMNTDNMAISGETIDYGPCAFMNVYRPDTVFSSIDSYGRYAYGNQPPIAQWNLARLAAALLPLMDSDQETAATAATEVLSEFSPRFERYWLAGMRQKLGLQTEEAGDVELIQSLLAWMQRSRADFTNTFRDLSSAELPVDERYRQPDFLDWHSQWQRRLGREGRPTSLIVEMMRTVNPVVIPRNHLVEDALAAAENQDDLEPFRRLLAALETPYEAASACSLYRAAPADDAGYRTFCGT